MEEIALAARGATAPEFWFWVIAFIALSSLTGKAALTRLRRAHIVEDIPTSRVRSASQGYVELQGRSALLPGPPIVAPLTGSHCCWWSYRVEQKVVRKRRGGTEVSWRNISQGTSDELFLLTDDTGKCVVDPWGAEVMCVSRNRWYGNQRHPGLGMKRHRFGGKFRYSEKRLEVGGPIYAIGWFRTERAAVEKTPVAEEVRVLLTHWKRDQATLLARFDANRDGSIDLDEWETARRTALLEVRKERHQRSVQPGLDVLSHPPDKRPFLLAALPQPRVAKRLRGSAILFSLLSVTLSGIMVYMLLVRFS